MANEEAREAVDYTPAGIYVSAIKAGFSEDAAHSVADLVRGAHAAGVAEGRRQAREAAETVPVTQARNAALAAIDALGRTTVGEEPEWIETGVVSPEGTPEVVRNPAIEWRRISPGFTSTREAYEWLNRAR